ncbi:aminotransferase class I/II-fold pyridoxal phosphate-dependent enzyme [Desulfococcaceae bacterium HSG7]|nr:aminotransferase class I/II-fold pyridoxal phosphate-dependent enzyme [Desulfococcaceae bacterium HSG7]
MKNNHSITKFFSNSIDLLLKQNYAIDWDKRISECEKQKTYYQPLRSPMFIGNTDIEQQFELFNQLTLQFYNVLDDIPQLAKNSLELVKSQYNGNNFFESICVAEDIYNSTKSILEIDGQKIMTTLFNVNDYLGLSKDKMVMAASIAATSMYGTGGLGSRLLRGTTELHVMLEQSLTKFKGLDTKKNIDTITLPSGYMANLTLMSIIRDGKGTIVLDKKAHQSLLDGCQLSMKTGLEVKRFKHNDIDHVKEIVKRIRKNRKSSHKICIVIDGVYSMSGELAPLTELRDIAIRYDCFIVLDDAHSTGTVGDKGRGTLEFFNIYDWENHFIIMGTLGKSLGSVGGFITARADIIRILKYASHQIMFSTALTPPTLATALTALKIIENNSSIVKRLQRNAKYLKKGLTNLGFKTGNSQTHIIPVITGRGDKKYSEKDDILTIKLSNHIRRKGYYAPPILRPAVKAQRLRASVSAKHTIEQIDGFLKALKEGKEKILNSKA